MMMAISTKLTLLVLFLYVSVLAILATVLFIIYGTIGLATIITVIPLPFLLSSLRDSLSKKLEYLDENVFLGLYAELEHGDLLQKQEGIEKAKNDLQKHGKFMNITLYPKNLLKKLSAFLQLHNSFYEKLAQLLSISKEKLGKEPSRYNLAYSLDIENYYVSSPADDLIYAGLAGYILKEHIKLRNEAKTIYEKVNMERKRIFEEFEEFLKLNNLRLKPKPSGMVQQPY